MKGQLTSESYSCVGIRVESSTSILRNPNSPNSSSEMARTLENPKRKIPRPTVAAGTGEAIEDGDRFSSLPDPIIHYIFSFLETIDVIRLSAVSRKWRYLWLTMPNLNLDVSTVWSEPLKKMSFHAMYDKFKDFVNWVFVSQNESINIQRCRLFCFYLEDDYTLYRWINVLVRRNVQEFDLSLVSYTPFELPRCLVTCESLMSIKLCFDTPCVLKFPASCGFCRLKSLDLLRAELSDYNLLRNFISKSPFLEDLIMEACVFRDFDILEIFSATLKNVALHNSNTALAPDRDDEHDGLNNCELKVVCPKLVSFNYTGPSATDYFLEELKFLQNVHIHLERKLEDLDNYEDCFYEIQKLLEGVCNTEDLKLSFDSLEFIDAFVRLSISFHNLKSLTLFVGIDGRHIMTLLENSPNLEALKVYFEWIDDEGWEIYDHFEIQGNSILCLTKHLKMVELFEVEGFENDLKLVSFLLKNGRVLEKMSISWGIHIENPGKIVPKIMQFPRSSSVVAVTFLEP